MYTKVTGTGKKYAEAPKGKDGPMDSYNSFLNKGVINMNAGDAADYKMTDDEVNHHVIGVVMAQHFSLKAGLKKFGVPGEEATTKELTGFRVSPCWKIKSSQIARYCTSSYVGYRFQIVR